MRSQWLVCVAAAAGASLCGTVHAQDKPKAPAVAEEAAVTFETALARPDELPAGVKVVEGLRCASRAAADFFADPGFAGSLDAPPLRKASQSLEAEGGKPGSVLVFEYAGAVPSFLQRVLERSLWGAGDRSAERPDEVVVHGRLLWIVSFPYGDPGAEWAKERLRKRFSVPARRTRPKLANLEELLWAATEARGGGRTGLDLLKESGADLSDWSIGSYLCGEFSMVAQDYAGAETAYRRAAELHRTLADPLRPNLAWAAADGVGNALLAQKKFEEAAKALAKSKAEGRALRLVNDDTPHTAYALACALAQLGRWDASLRELTDAVDGDARWLKLALKDDSLAEARKRPEFRVVLDLDAPKPAPVPPKPAAPARPAEPVTFEALQIQAKELPAGWNLVEGLQCVSTGAAEFFRTPDAAKIVQRKLGSRAGAPPVPPMPQPSRSACQSIVREDGTAGSVLLFEYAADVSPDVEGFLSSYVWGKGGPSVRNPEEFLTHGRHFWVFSFPRGDAAGEWAKERLRTRFRIPAHRTRPEIVPLMRRIAAASEKNDADQGLRLLDSRAPLLADCAFAWFLRGEFGVGKSDPALSERGYRRALDLHEALVDPLDEGLVWASLDGLGTALLLQKKLEPARATLVRAKDLAAEQRRKDASGTSYNLACALALLKRYDESLAELKAAIAAKPSWKDSARDDADFAEARKRPDFQALLAK